MGLMGFGYPIIRKGFHGMGKKSLFRDWWPSSNMDAPWYIIQHLIVVWLYLVIDPILFPWMSHSVIQESPSMVKSLSLDHGTSIITISGFDFLTLQTRTQLSSPIHLGSVCMPHGQKSHVMRWVVDPRKTETSTFPFVDEPEVSRLVNWLWVITLMPFSYTLQ